jgi:uroporphyrinogen-III decarboxylase
MCLFERAWSLRGFDGLLMDMLERTEWVEELLDRITEIQVTLSRRFVAAGVDGGYFGDDYGAQRAMLFSPRLWRRLIKPRLAKMFSVFVDAGLPVILHSDGDIRKILPDLVEIGLTTLNPAQPEVLDHTWLQKEYGTKLSFYGGISTQGVLPNGTVEEVRAATIACAGAMRDRAAARRFAPDAIRYSCPQRGGDARCFQWNQCLTGRWTRTPAPSVSRRASAKRSAASRSYGHARPAAWI